MALTDAELEQLKTLPQLVDLDVSDTKATDAGMKNFQAAMPKCAVKNAAATQNAN